MINRTRINKVRYQFPGTEFSKASSFLSADRATHHAGQK